MLTKLRRHLTYANVVSTLCLFILLGGSAFAAVRLSRNSVRSAHIKNAQVKNPDLARNAVNSAKVGDASLLSQDFAPGQLPAGPEGKQGPQGVPGTARAYAVVNAPGGAPFLVPEWTKNFTAVRRAGTGVYCLTPAAGIDPNTHPAVTSVDGFGTVVPVGDASAVSHRLPCGGAGGEEYLVATYRHGTSGEFGQLSTPSASADDISFIIVVP